ncbi:MAG TPA: hypothetical protein VGH72_28980, partial [Pseudonocardia sp.]
PGTTVWSRAGRTADGVTRLALFHDADRGQTLSVVPASVPTTVSRFDPATGQLHNLGPAAGELRLRCGPDELVCLLLTDGDRSVPGETVLCAGWTLDIGAEPARPIEVDRGWEEQGWPTFSGIAEYRSRFELPPADLAWPDWELVLARVHTGADIELNGTVIGRFGWVRSTAGCRPACSARPATSSASGSPPRRRTGTTPGLVSRATAWIRAGSAPRRFSAPGWPGVRCTSCDQAGRRDTGPAGEGDPPAVRHRRAWNPPDPVSPTGDPVSRIANSFADW